jgi:hypothetical protein
MLSRVAHLLDHEGQVVVDVLGGGFVAGRHGDLLVIGQSRSSKAVRNSNTVIWA